MIIFKDLLNPNQEFFCDQTFKYEVEGDFLIKLTAKYIQKPSDDMSSVNIGANPSAEEQEEALDDGSGGNQKVLDICFYHKLEESDILSDKKILKKYIGAYMTAISDKLEAEDPKALEEFLRVGKEGGKERIAKIFKEGGDNLTCFVGENFEFPDEKVKDGKKTLDVQHGIVLGVWNDDGLSLTLYMFKHGVQEEKV